MSPLSGVSGWSGWSFLLIQLSVLAVCIVPLGTYLARLYSNQATFLAPIFGWIEHALYKAAGINPHRAMTWRAYALASLSFSTLGFIVLYLLLVGQAALPGNASHLPGLAPEQAFTLAAGFVSDAPLPAGVNAPTLSLFSRLAGLTVQDFLSAAVGISVFVAVARGLSGKSDGAIGNFWADLIRTILYVLLPISIAYVALLSTAGVIETLDAYIPGIGAPTLPGATTEALRLTTTDSGSLVNANAAHIAAVATPATTTMAFLSEVLIPAALCYAFGLIVGDLRQALVMLILASAAAIGHLWLQGSSRPAGVIGGVALLSELIAFAILAGTLFNWVRGRPATYLGRRLRAFDIAMAAAATLAPSGVLIAVASGGGTPAIYLLLGLAILAGRFWVIIPTLAIAGSLSAPRNSAVPLVANG